jgi:hypothetical protein
MHLYFAALLLFTPLDPLTHLQYIPPMRDCYKIIGNDGIHFMTATIVAWIPVFWQEGFHPQLLDDGASCARVCG